MSKSSAHAAIEAVARDSYGRLIAYLASRAGDVAGAEDALRMHSLRRWSDGRRMAFRKSPKRGCYESLVIG